MIAADEPRVQTLLSRLSPYARALLERCAAYALSIHADEVGPEHLLSTLMDDEACAAHQLALHAFADPSTISEEARALSAGIMISGSNASLPFSAFGVRALRAARALASTRRATIVEPAHLLLAAFDESPEDVREALYDSGWSREGLEALLQTAADGAAHVRDEGALFRSFSDDAKRVLSLAAKLARQSESPSISAAHLLIAGLSWNSSHERAAGLPTSRARMLLRGRLVDTSPVLGGPLAPDDALITFLTALPEGATTLDLLRRFHAGDVPELAQVLTRHKVSLALLDRAGSAFRDP